MLVQNNLWAQQTDSNYTVEEEEVYEDEYEENYEEANPEPATYRYKPDIREPGTPSVNNTRDIDQQKWDKLTNDPEFNYQKAKPEKPADFSWWYKFVTAVMNFFTNGFGRILLLLLLALAVIFIVFKIVQLNGNVLFAKGDKKLNTNSDELSDDFVPDNWEQSIQNAANTGNYRLAVRHLYRYLLHTMQEKEIITYQISKTNYQYMYELNGTNHYKPFVQLTRDYEYAWYGGFNIAQNQFEYYQQQINQFKNTL